MDVRQLKYFVAIVESGSLTKAAERVFVAQPALSQQMAALEDDLNCRLLVRSSQGVYPTAAGNALYTHALAIIRQMEAARQNVRLSDFQGETGLVSLGLPPTLSQPIGVPLLERLHHDFPAVRLQLHESFGGHLQELRSQGRLDMTIHFRDHARPGTTIDLLFEERLFLIGTPPGWEPSREPCRFIDLSGVPLLVPNTEQGLRQVLERSFASVHADLNIIAEIHSHTVMLDAIAAGVGCAIIPASALPKDFQDRGLARLMIDPEVSHAVSLFWNSSATQTPVNLTVRRLIHEIVENAVLSGEWPGTSLPAPKKSPAELAVV